MIRPSALQISEHCGLSAKLAEEFPESSVAAERGSALHKEIHDWLMSGEPPRCPSLEVAALLASWRPPASIESEVKVRLVDPETDALITEGTADALWTEPDGLLSVLDFKSGRIEFVAPPGENLQLAAYGLAAALARDAKEFRVGLCFLDADGPTWLWSERYGHETWGGIWERVARAAGMPPIAVKGPHCAQCWSRTKCPAYLMPADPVARDLDLAPLTSTALVTPDAVLRLHLASKALAEIADRGDAYVRAFVVAHGPLPDGAGKELRLVEVAGRRSVALKAAEKAGLLPALEAAGAVSHGAPSQRLSWVKR